MASAKQIAAAVTTPGIAGGSTTLKTVRSGECPSDRPASSSEVGIESITLCIVMIA